MAKRGRKPRMTPEAIEALREPVNFLYWHTSCSQARIARRYGLSSDQVRGLLVGREEYERMSTAGETRNGND